MVHFRTGQLVRIIANAKESLNGMRKIVLSSFPLEVIIKPPVALYGCDMRKFDILTGKGKEYLNTNEKMSIFLNNMKNDNSVKENLVLYLWEEQKPEQHTSPDAGPGHFEKVARAGRSSAGAEPSAPSATSRNSRP